MIDPNLSTILIFVILLLCVVAHFAMQNVRQVYDRMIVQLQHDRDQARAEAAVFRRLCIPNFARAEALSSAMTSTAAAPPSPTPTSEAGARATADQKGRPADNSTSAAAPSNRRPMNPAMDKRLRWQDRFKLLTRQHNTPQQKTKTLAEALLAAEAKKKEQAHVAS